MSTITGRSTNWHLSPRWNRALDDHQTQILFLGSDSAASFPLRCADVTDIQARLLQTSMGCPSHRSHGSHRPAMGNPPVQILGLSCPAPLKAEHLLWWLKHSCALESRALACLWDRASLWFGYIVRTNLAGIVKHLSMEMSFGAKISNKRSPRCFEKP